MNDDEGGWETAGRRVGGSGGTRTWGSSSWGASAFGGGGGGKGREMPAAFGGGDPHKAERRAAAEAQAAREATEAREKRAAEEKERKRIADATNFSSEEFYPSLGGGSSSAAAKPKPAMNFSKVVSEMAVREEIRRIEEEREAAAAAVAAAHDRTERAMARRHIYARDSYEIQHFAYADDDEDAPNDDYPEESDDEEPPPVAEEEDGEFNADIGSSRRRGDKGIW